MITFKDYLGIFYLGNEYNESFWREKDFNDVKSFSFKNLMLEENVRQNIFEVIGRNLSEKFFNEVHDINLKIEIDGVQAIINRVVYEDEIAKKEKRIKKISVLSLSTGLKLNSTIKLMYAYNVAIKAGYSIEEATILYISKVKGKFQEITFVESNYMNIRNDKKSIDSDLTIKTMDFLRDKSGLTLPENNKGSSQDYQLRAFEHLIEVHKNFWNIVKDYREKINFKAPAIAHNKVRKNDGDYWAPPGDFIIDKNNNIDFSLYNFMGGTPSSYNNKFKKERRVYFDFETICLPFSVYEGTIPYQQVPLQYSIIVTNKNNEIIKEINEVFNFHEFSSESLLEYFKKMISDLYIENAVYIAHNKDFENRSLGELMQTFIDCSNFTNDYKQKLASIMGSSGAIDTQKIFAENYSFDAFKNKSSIKYINEWMMKYRDDLIQKYNIKNYSDLDVSNGLEAQNLLTEMYFHLHDEDATIKMLKELKEYCYNDVVSMLPIMDFLEENMEGG